MTDLMPTNFLRDLRESLRNELDALHVEVDPLDPRPIEVIYFGSKLKLIEPSPRQVHLAVGFRVPRELRKAYKRLRNMIRDGADLRPHQSGDSRLTWKSDGLLNDWRIQHLHLGFGPLDSRGLAPRTRDVLFGVFLPADACLIAIRPHGRDHGDLWGRDFLVEVVRQNWPDLFTGVRTELIPVANQDKLTARDRVHARRSLTTFVELSDGVYFPIGGGSATDGTNPLAVSRADRLVGKVNALEAYVQGNFQQVANGLAADGHVLPDKVALKLRYDRDRFVADVVGTRIQFPLA